MVVELADFGSDFSDLPSLESVSRIEHGTVLLLELPQLGVDVKRATEVGLPLFVSVLRQIPEAVEELLGLFQEMAKLADDLPLVFL